MSRVWRLKSMPGYVNAAQLCYEYFSHFNFIFYFLLCDISLSPVALIRFTYLLPVLYLFMHISSSLFIYILALYKRCIMCVLLYFVNVHALVGD